MREIAATSRRRSGASQPRATLAKLSCILTSVAIASRWLTKHRSSPPVQQDPSPPDLQVTHEIGPAGRVPQQRNIREEGTTETPPGTFRGRHWAGFMTVSGQKQAIDALTERQAA